MVDVNTFPDTLTGTLTLKAPFLIIPISLIDVNEISFDLYASRTGTNLRFELHDTGGFIISITPNVLIANVWQTIDWDISAVANVDKDNIDTFTIVVINDDAPNTFFVDNFHINLLDVLIVPNPVPLVLAVQAPDIFGDHVFGVDEVEALIAVEAPLPLVFAELSTITASISVVEPLIVVTNIPDTQEITGTLEAPIPNVIKEPATLALSISLLPPFIISVQQIFINVEAPVPVVTLDSVVDQAIDILAEPPIPNVIPEAVTVGATLSVQEPIINVIPTPAVVPLLINVVTPDGIALTITPATLAGALSVVAPTVIVTHLDTTQTLAIGVVEPVTEVSDLPSQATLAIGIEIPIPNIIVVGGVLAISVSVLGPTPVISKLPLKLTMGIFGPNMLNPKKGFLRVKIVKFISDPIQTGGCPQCGTFLYDTGRDIKTEQVVHGRHWETRYADDFTRCARCGFPVKRYRHPSYNEGDWVGWGLKYQEFEVVPNEPLDC